MKKIIFLILLILPFLNFGQIQIGENINGDTAQDLFGTSSSISSNGNRIAVGATEDRTSDSGAGYVRVFENQLGTWVQIGQDLGGDEVFNEFGASVSLSSDGNVVAIGAPMTDSSVFTSNGKVKIFSFDGTTWNQMGGDLSGDIQSRFGASVSLSSDGSIVAVGAPSTAVTGDATPEGRVRVYRFNGTDWVQLGGNIDGFGRNLTGTSVSLSSDGTILAVGSPNRLNNLVGVTGQAVIFRLSSDETSWSLMGQAINGVGNERLGRAVSISSDGTIFAVSSSAYTSVYKYENTSDIWTQIGSDITYAEALGQHIGLSSDGDVLAVGSIFLDNSVSTGVVEIFQNQSNTWTQIGANILGELPSDRFGRSVAISEDKTTLIAGTPLNDTNGLSSGQVRVYDLSAIICADLIPNAPVMPTPLDGASNIALGTNNSINFSWENVTGGIITSHVLNIGTTNPPTEFEFANFVNGDALDNFANNTTYYWSVDVTNCAGTTMGTIWSFTTEEACNITAPTQVINPIPADGATNVSLSGMFNELNFLWENGIGEPGTSFTLNFGTTDVSEFTLNDFSIGDSLPGLLNNTLYQWRIDAINCSGTTIGDVWSFTTGETLSINTNEIEQIKVYPNPTTDILNIKTSLEINRIEIYDLLGKNIKSYTKVSNSAIDISQLETGLYLVKVYSKDKSKTFKITKR